MKCKVFTDDQSLKYLYTQSELNMHQRRWLELLADYDLDFTYHEGNAILVTDALSKKTTHSVSALTGSDEFIEILLN